MSLPNPGVVPTCRETPRSWSAQSHCERAAAAVAPIVVLVVVALVVVVVVVVVGRLVLPDSVHEHQCQSPYATHTWALV